MKRLVLPLAIALAAIVGPAVPADASGGRHCYVRVTGQEADGQLVTSAPRCYASERQANDAARASGGEQRSASGSGILAVHRDGAGNSTSVAGSNCLGGWINTSAYWFANMTYTTNVDCPVVRHYYSANLGGQTQDTYPGNGNLFAPLYHHVGSIQYLT